MFAQCSKIIYSAKLEINNILLHFKSIIRRKIKNLVDKDILILFKRTQAIYKRLYVIEQIKIKFVAKLQDLNQKRLCIEKRPGHKTLLFSSISNYFLYI